jgi:hypothetical protein
MFSRKRENQLPPFIIFGRDSHDERLQEVKPSVYIILLALALVECTLYAFISLYPLQPMLLSALLLYIF